MPSKPLSKAYYWIANQGAAGQFVIKCVNHGIIKGVKILGIKARQDKTCLTIVSHKYQFMYIGIPKTATRSFMEAFATGGREAFNSEWFETPADYRRMLAAYPGYFKFTFTRNPWARAVSCYNSKIKDAFLSKQARIMCFYDGLSPDMSFKDFARWLNTGEGADERADRHWISQHVLLSDDTGRPVYDFAGRYENLDADLKAVQEKIGFPPVALGQQGFISDNRDYRSYYDDEAKELIARRYARDIELFGYEF